MVGAAPGVSVVVVAFRAREHVLACLRSLERHAGVDHEVVVVDDGSGDGTPEAVRDAFPGVHVIAKARNEGLPAGRNAALPVVRGDKVLMLDADTEVRPGAIAELAGALDRHPEAGVVGPRLISADGALHPSCRRFPPYVIPPRLRSLRDPDAPPARSQRRHLMEDFDHATERAVVWVTGAAHMWRRELADRIGPYDERVSSYGGEDMEWCLRAWAAGYEVRYVPTATVVHHWQDVVGRSGIGRKQLRAVRDLVYIRHKHRALARDERLAAANG